MDSSMDSLLKACVSSASYVFSGTNTVWPKEESGDREGCPAVYQNGLPPVTHYPHTKGGALGSVTQYKPYSCTSVPSLNKKVSLEKDFLQESQNTVSENEFTSPTTGACRVEECTQYLVEGIPTSTSTTTCPSLPLKPRPSSSGGEGRWVRPLGYAERFMTLAGYWGNMSTVYALWLDSTGPVTYEAIKNTSHLMFRKMPHLKLCIGNHKGARWWREMEPERLDIEEIRTNDVIGTFESLLKRRYDIQEGPLWFVRFITPQTGNGLVRDTNFNLRRKYVCIFGFHHNVSDGTTNMNFCNIFLSLLNDVILGKELDLKEEGRFAFPIHDQISDDIKSYAFCVKLFVKRFYTGLIWYCRYVNNFIQHYPMPRDRDGCTMVLSSELDEITTERLLKRCKMEGVTLNSVFTAAANIGMYRMILQRDGSMESTTFDNQQAVNMRRYWPKEARKNSFGCHISMLDVHIPTKKEDIQNFWEYARYVQDIISHDLNVEKRVLKMQPMCEKLWLALFVNSIVSYLRIRSSNDGHYCITNMGDVSSIFSGEGEAVEVSRILRSVSCHFMQTLCQHTLQTFRGKFYYSLDYYPQKMSVDTARAYASSLMDTLRYVIHLPN